jgi:TRAP transporter 4TM/12TM fusion protein
MTSSADDTVKETQPAAIPVWCDRLRSSLAVAIFGFGVWTVLSWQFDDAEIRAIFLAFTLLYSLSFFGPGKRPRGKFGLAVDLVAAALGVAVALYIALDFEEVFNRAGAVMTRDLIVAGIAIVVILEATRRTAGWALPILSVVFLLYPLVYGPYMPGLLRASPFGLERVLTGQYLSLDGILGPAIRVMIEYIFLFIIFGAFLQRFGVTEFFIDFAKAIAGNRRGGSAKVAVVASAMMGTVSGSAVANVVSTGVITIPMMTREGYEAPFAGAVEASASTGGQIMPPIMGAAAFLMSEFARIPYSQIILHALVPAILYFITVWLAVHFEAIRLGLQGAAAEALPKLWAVLRERGTGLIPIVFVTTLIMMDHNLPEAVLMAICVTVICAAVTPKLRHLVTIPNLVGAIREGIDNSIALFTASACAGIVIGVVSLTGLGLKISTLIIDIADGVAVVALVLSAITCLIMGLGLPTQIIYLTLAILVAPGLVEMGITVAGAHLFIMYFGMMSMVTPPVCFAAFAAASISGAKMMQTGILAFRLALAGQLIPFVFAYNPGVLLIGSPGAIILDILRALAVLFAGGLAFELFRLTPYERDETASKALIYLRRFAFGMAAGSLIFPHMATTIAGAVLLGVGLAVALVPGYGAGRADQAPTL